MYQYSTARTNLISAAGTRFVWREAGAEHEGIPVVCFSYLMSTMAAVFINQKPGVWNQTVQFMGTGNRNHSIMFSCYN